MPKPKDTSSPHAKRPSLAAEFVRSTQGTAMSSRFGVQTAKARLAFSTNCRYTGIVKKVVRRAEPLKGHRHGLRFQACSSLRPLTIRDQYTNCATRLNIPNRTTTPN